MKFYHGSKDGEIKRLDRNHSRDGFVYATSSRLVALTYAVKARPNLFTTEKGKECFLEVFPNLFEKVVEGKSAYIYTLEDKGFEPIPQSERCGHQHCFRVASNVKIVDKEFIPSIYDELMKYVESGEFVVVRYNKMPKMKRNSIVEEMAKTAKTLSQDVIDNPENFWSMFLEQKLYHVSNVPNLKVLKPRVSSHGKAYVYATKNLEFSLLFGSTKSKGDFDGTYGIKDGVPYFYEAYEGAFRRRFEGEKCYIYEVDPTDFQEEKTTFKGEVVSEVPVKILGCEVVEDLYAYLNDLIAKGEIVFKKYSLDAEYQKMIRAHLKNRLEMFGICKNKEASIYKFCMEKYPDIVNEVANSLKND